jgi:hypothetical protein
MSAILIISTPAVIPPRKSSLLGLGDAGDHQPPDPGERFNPAECGSTRPSKTSRRPSEPGCGEGFHRPIVPPWDNLPLFRLPEAPSRPGKPRISSIRHGFESLLLHYFSQYNQMVMALFEPPGSKSSSAPASPGAIYERASTSNGGHCASRTLFNPRRHSLERAQPSFTFTR